MAIKLKNIKFDGFKSTERIASISFTNEISIVYADNGCGKTSLLKGIYSFLDQNEEHLKLLKVKKVTCTYINEVVVGLSKETTIVVSYNDKTRTFDWKQFEKSDLVKLKSLSIAIERGIGSKSLQHVDATDIEEFFETKHSLSNAMTHISKPMRRKLSNEIFDFLTNINKLKFNSIKNLDQDFNFDHVYLENFEVKDLEYLILEEYKKSVLERYININNTFMVAFNNVVSAHFSKNINGPSDGEEIQSLAAIDLFSHKERLISILRESENFLKSNKSNLLKSNELISKFSFKDKFINVLESINDINQAELVVDDLFVSSIFKSLLNHIDNNDDVLPRFKLLVNKFNDYLIDGKKILVESEGHSEGNVFIQVGENRHNLDDLSSGERHILTFLVTVLFKCNDRDILLIDEPEMSLNTSWQSELLGLLKELVPNTQIIVASHSPFIVNGRSDYLCELVVDR